LSYSHAGFDVSTFRNAESGAVNDLATPEQLPPDIKPQSNGHRCAQCNGKPDGKEEPHPDGDRLVWLHKECRRFYARQAAATVDNEPSR
jgi:hypothetical protein